MQTDRQIQGLGQFEGLFKEDGVHDGKAVVGKAGRAALREGAQIGKLFTGHAKGHIGAAVEVNGKFSAAGKDVAQDFDTVYRRLGVGHQDDGSITARYRGLRAGGEVLLMCKARIAEMRVGIYESRARDHAGGIQNGGAYGGHQVLLYFDKAAVVDQNVAPSLGAGGGIDHITVLDQ